MPLRVLFVCTGNICRSPYLERRARYLVESGAIPNLTSADVTFASAGTRPIEGRRMDRPTADLLQAHGGDASEHSSRAITTAMLLESDLILTADREHRRRTVQDVPSVAGRTFTIGGFAAALQTLPQDRSIAELLADKAAVQVLRKPIAADIIDPYGRDPQVLLDAVETMESYLAVILPRLA